MNPRFFVDTDLATERVLALPEGVAHHAQRVLRLRAGTAITLFNGRGGEYAATLLADGQARIGDFDPVERESPVPTTLLQAWVAADKLDWIVEKATELGAAHIVLWPAERSGVRLAGERLARRLAHLRAVTEAACCQCGRNRLPTVDAADPLAAALAAADATVRLLLDAEGEPLAAQVAQAASVAFAVGPEGGFTTTERALAARHGWHTARLGASVLRTETAGLAALAAVAVLSSGKADS
jgi:16S rRNA (uracil1498-N3)-methyltransferase